MQVVIYYLPSGSLEVMKASSSGDLWLLPRLKRANRSHTHPNKRALFDWKVFGTRNRNEVSGTCSYMFILTFWPFPFLLRYNLSQQKAQT